MNHMRVFFSLVTPKMSKWVILRLLKLILAFNFKGCMRTYFSATLEDPNSSFYLFIETFGLPTFKG